LSTIVIHAKNDPKDSWLEVDGERVGGVQFIQVVEQVQQATLDVVLTTFVGEEGGFEVVWEDWPSRT
jgi:hypothetical protein